MTVRELSKALLPPWLADGDGEKMSHTVGLHFDASLESTLIGVGASFAGQQSPTCLPYLADDALLERAPNETDDAFAIRITKSLDTNRRRGNASVLCDQLATWFYPDPFNEIRLVSNSSLWHKYNRSTKLTTRIQASNWKWDPGYATNPNRGWVIIYASIFSQFQRVTRGSRVRGLGTIGSSATQSQVEQIRSIVRNWKPAHIRCVNIIITFSNEFDETTYYYQSCDLRGELTSWRLSTNSIFWAFT